MDLEQQGQQLAEQLAAAQEEREAFRQKQDDLQQRLGAAQLALAQLEQQQETFQSVQQVRPAQRWCQQAPSVGWMRACIHGATWLTCAPPTCLPAAAPERAGDGAAHVR